VIGVYLDHLSFPWVESVFRLAKQTEVVLFLNNFGPVDVHSPIAILPSFNIWDFRGPIIAGDIFSARYLTEYTLIKDKYFYINNIDWNNQQFTAMDVLTATSMELACEPTFAPLVKATFKEPKLVRNWNYEDIKRLLGR